ncbi:TetR/AcrR family transcriptional regulator [Mesorhizobium sp. CO1-1-8]|uniref:TetR/AcrR family transcriptional regulator n=1 Tax=Mesorhizobium sp. CO1-1-8 TaxID=2876631 RepID=UPI001CD0FA3D|nr:TetR/AcrR family transcriptional regulator [Mesorhizobium sp. CO1-1-8]MBZ9772420.1 TetR family transcriptional regulator [Mesorhizobium sp. CO1-1-8]
MNSTKEKILSVAIDEFSARGFRGARVQHIATAAHANLRMIYHYFGNKEGLYISCLEDIYASVRRAELAVDFGTLKPQDALRKLIDDTFDFFISHPQFAGIVASENSEKGKYISRSGEIPKMAATMIQNIGSLLDRGAKLGAFRSGIDPVQLFITLHGLCSVHISSRYTLSKMLDIELGNDEWITQRKRHVRDVIVSYLKA